MTIATVEEIYEQIVKRLPATERLRLVEKIARDLSASAVEATRELKPTERQNKALQHMVAVSEELALYDE